MKAGFATEPPHFADEDVDDLEKDTLTNLDAVVKNSSIIHQSSLRNSGGGFRSSDRFKFNASESIT